MKKTLIILGIIVVLAIVVGLAVVIKNRENHIEQNNIEQNAVAMKTEIAEIINNNSILPIKYMTLFDNDDPSLKKYDRLDNYMSKDFRDEGLFFSYYGYPNDESEFYLCEISISNKEYSILGVNIGDNMRDAISKIESYGFKVENNIDYFEVSFIYDDVTITIESDIENDDEDNESVKSISIKTDSEYLGNRIY